MAHSATNFSSDRSLTDVLAAPFKAVGRTLISIAESGPRMEQVRRLNAISDEELAERGLTRADVVRRIFGGSIYL